MVFDVCEILMHQRAILVAAWAQDPMVTRIFTQIFRFTTTLKPTRNTSISRNRTVLVLTSMKHILDKIRSLQATNMEIMDRINTSPESINWNTYAKTWDPTNGFHIEKTSHTLSKATILDGVSVETDGMETHVWCLLDESSGEFADNLKCSKLKWCVATRLNDSMLQQVEHLTALLQVPTPTESYSSTETTQYEGLAETELQKYLTNYELLYVLFDKLEDILVYRPRQQLEKLTAKAAEVSASIKEMEAMITEGNKSFAPLSALEVAESTGRMKKKKKKRAKMAGK